MEQQSPTTIIGTYEQGDAAGRAIIRTAMGFLHVQLRRDVHKRKGDIVTDADVQPQP